MTYKVKLVSQTNAIILIITLLAIFFSVAGLFLPSRGLQDSGLSILLIAVIAIITYILWQIFVTGRTEWTIDEREINIVWAKKFILSGNKDMNLKWGEIENISRGRDPKYYNLKIKLTSGKTIKFFHDAMTTRDDFEEMLKSLYQTFNNKKATATQA